MRRCQVALAAGPPTREALLKSLQPNATQSEIDRQLQDFAPVREQVRLLLEERITDAEEIARRLGKSKDTIRHHLRRIRDRDA